MVTELKWNPFNDNIIASASEDSTVGGDPYNWAQLHKYIGEIVAYSRWCSHTSFDRLVDEIMRSFSSHFFYRLASDCWKRLGQRRIGPQGVIRILDIFSINISPIFCIRQIILWNVSSGECLVSIDCHQDVIQCMIFNRHGSLLATTCRDRLVRIFEIRKVAYDPQSKPIFAVFHPRCEFWTPELVPFCTKEPVRMDPNRPRWCLSAMDRSWWPPDRPSPVEDRWPCGIAWATNLHFLVLSLLFPSQDDLQCPLFTLEVDTSSGMLMPFYDYELSILFIAGKVNQAHHGD